MAVNFNHCNSISAVVGLGLYNETIDVHGLGVGLHGGLTGPNVGLGQLGLISHKVVEMKKTYVSPNRFQLYSVIDYVPVPVPDQNRPAFPLLETTTVTEVVKTTRLLTSTSVLERVFASSSSTGVSNQGTFSTSGFCFPAQTAVTNQSNQVMSLLRSENDPLMNQETLNIYNQNNNIHGNIKTETVPNPTYVEGVGFDQTADILPNPDKLHKSNDNMNLEKGGPPSYFNPHRDDPCSHIVKHQPSPQKQRNQNFEEVCDYPLGYDGKTHSLPNYPEGVYGCPICFATFYTSQTFAAHIRGHYKQESREQRRRRIAAKFRRKNLRSAGSSYGLTAIAKPKGCSESRKNDTGVKIKNLKVELCLNLNAAPEDTTKNGPLHDVVIKEEPM